MTGESNHSFQHIPSTFNVVIQDLVANSCVKILFVLPDTHVTSCSTLSQLESSWNMPEPSGKKKSIGGITWSFSTFRNSADLL